MIGQLTEWNGAVMSTRPINLVVFDMDGTVVDSMSALKTLAVEHMLATYEHFDAEQLASLYEKTSGVPFISQLHRAFTGHPDNQQCADLYETAHAKAAKTFKLAKDVDKLIHGLNKNHIRTALVSSTQRYIVQEMMPQLDDLQFGYVAGWTPDKPKGEQIRDAMRRFDIHYDYTLYVGDSDLDAEFARVAMVRFLHVDHSLVAKAVRDVIQTHNHK